jgi:hypothetical protein
MIYTYVFSGLYWVMPLRCHNQRVTYRALLFVSRRIHSETALLPYALSTFVLNNDNAGAVCDPRSFLGATRAFWQNLSVEQADSITSLYIHHDSMREHWSAPEMGDLSFLDKLPRLHVLQVVHWGCKTVVHINEGKMVVHTDRSQAEKLFGTGEELHMALWKGLRAWRSDADFQFSIVQEHEGCLKWWYE